MKFSIRDKTVAVYVFVFIAAIGLVLLNSDIGQFTDPTGLTKEEYKVSSTSDWNQGTFEFTRASSGALYLESPSVLNNKDYEMKDGVRTQTNDYWGGYTFQVERPTIVSKLRGGIENVDHRNSLILALYEAPGIDMRGQNANSLLAYEHPNFKGGRMATAHIDDVLLIPSRTYLLAAGADHGNIFDTEEINDNSLEFNEKYISDWGPNNGEMFDWGLSSDARGQNYVVNNNADSDTTEAQYQLGMELSPAKAKYTSKTFRPGSEVVWDDLTIRYHANHLDETTKNIKLTIHIDSRSRTYNFNGQSGTSIEETVNLGLTGSNMWFEIEMETDDYDNSGARPFVEAVMVTYDQDLTSGVPDIPDIPDFCGDLICQDSESEITCPVDCGTPDLPGLCGDFECGDGENKFTCPIDCGTPDLPDTPDYHLGCYFGACAVLPGEGPDDCTACDEFDEIIPDTGIEPSDYTQTHLGCVQGMCAVLPGEGPNTCSLASSCPGGLFVEPQNAFSEDFENYDIGTELTDPLEEQAEVAEDIVNIVYDYPNSNIPWSVESGLTGRSAKSNSNLGSGDTSVFKVVMDISGDEGAAYLLEFDYEVETNSDENTFVYNLDRQTSPYESQAEEFCLLQHGDTNGRKTFGANTQTLSASIIGNPEEGVNNCAIVYPGLNVLRFGFRIANEDSPGNDFAYIDNIKLERIK